MVGSIYAQALLDQARQYGKYHITLYIDRKPITITESTLKHLFTKLK